MSLPNVSASEPAQPAHWCDGTGSASTGPLDYAAAVRYLYEELTPERPLGFHGYGTDRARALLRRLGDPQESVPNVHVAGTAGKGSVCTFVAAILTAHGFRVGAHLSPHAYELVERFQIDGRHTDLNFVDLDAVIRDARVGRQGTVLRLPGRAPACKR